MIAGIPQTFNAPIKPITVKLNGSFKEMGKQYIDQLGQTLLNQLTLMRQEILPTNPEKMGAYLESKKLLIKVAKKNWYPDEIKQFFKGALSTPFAKLNKLTPEDFIELDQAFALSNLARDLDEVQPAFKGSSSLLGMKKPTQGAVIARNHDWTHLHCMTYSPVVVEMFNPDNNYPNALIMVGPAGMISNPSMWNSNGFQLSVNIAGDCVDYEASSEMQKRPYFLAQCFVAMMQAGTFVELHERIKNLPTNYGCTISLAGPSGELVAIEASPINKNQEIDTDFVNRDRLPVSEENQDLSDNNPELIAVTNDFHLKEWQSIVGKPLPIETPTHSRQRYEYLVRAGVKYKDKITEKPLRTLDQIMQVKFMPEEPSGATIDYLSLVASSNQHATCYTSLFDTHKAAVEQKRLAGPKLKVHFQQQATAQAPGKWTALQSFRFDNWRLCTKNERQLAKSLKEFIEQERLMSQVFKDLNYVAIAIDPTKRKSRKSVYISSAQSAPILIEDKESKEKKKTKHKKKIQKKLSEYAHTIHSSSQIDVKKEIEFKVPKLSIEEYKNLFEHCAIYDVSAGMLYLDFERNISSRLKVGSTTKDLSDALLKFTVTTEKLLRSYMQAIHHCTEFQSFFRMLEKSKRKEIDQFSEGLKGAPMSGTEGLAGKLFQHFMRVPLSLRDLIKYVNECEDQSIKQYGARLEVVFNEIKEYTKEINEESSMPKYK